MVWKPQRPNTAYTQSAGSGAAGRMRVRHSRAAHSIPQPVQKCIDHPPTHPPTCVGPVPFPVHNIHISKQLRGVQSQEGKQQDEQRARHPADCRVHDVEQRATARVAGTPSALIQHCCTCQATHQPSTALPGHSPTQYRHRIRQRQNASTNNYRPFQRGVDRQGSGGNTPRERAHSRTHPASLPLPAVMTWPIAVKVLPVRWAGYSSGVA
jgi:hypothetical protein